MNREVRRQAADEAADAHVLHDGGIHAGGDDGAQMLLGGGQLVLEDQCVEGDVTLHPAPMQEFHQPGQIGDGEIVRPHPGVEFFQAEINCIRTVLDGGLGAIPIAGGREQLGQRRRAECGVRNFLRARHAALNCEQVSHGISVTAWRRRNKTSLRFSRGGWRPRLP